MQPLAERQTCHLRLLINQNARPTLGEFQTTNRRCLSLEPGMRAATVQVDNSRRRFGLRLRSLPEGDQVKELDCCVALALGLSRRAGTNLLPRKQAHSARLSLSTMRKPQSER